MYTIWINLYLLKNKRNNAGKVKRDVISTRFDKSTLAIDGICVSVGKIDDFLRNTVAEDNGEKNAGSLLLNKDEFKSAPNFGNIRSSPVPATSLFIPVISKRIDGNDGLYNWLLFLFFDNKVFNFVFGLEDGGQKIS